MMVELKGKQIAVLALDGFEESELTEPVRALRESGADVRVFSEKRGKIQAFKHHDKSIEVEVDGTFDELDPHEFDGVLLPGGALNADALRVVEKAQEFVRAMNEANKPIAVICHAPWLLASSGLAKGRSLTSFHTIADDLRNAGAEWTDREVVVDRNLVTSRKPDDIPAFNREFIQILGSRQELEEQFARWRA
ncbi:MAG: type 1 glutamine amidotransferase [Candidatus Eremiobacteraeota bacterium]|nr:type 1 glutamine amidotransferase [Candidatus Eremiobacteraeota bacterium]